MAQVLKVGDRDLSPYVRVAHDDGLDPANPEFSEPQFSGSPALGDGQSFVGDAVNNRLMSYPLILSADSTDELYALVREINGDLVKGAQVEYRSGGASQSTFFDLERGRLEPKFEFWIDQAAKVRAMLHLWVRPYGHTGTYRTVIPSFVATGPQTLQATGILGDVFAQGLLRVDSGPTYLASPVHPHMIAFGISQSPSYVGVWRAASLTNVGASSALIGASGAVASQYLGVNASPVGIQAFAWLQFPDGDLKNYEGRQRMLVVARSRVALASGAPAISAVAGANSLHDGRRIGSVVASHSAQWQVYDVGEWSVPRASGLKHPDQSERIEFFWSSASPGQPSSIAASLIASPAFQISAIMLVPLDVAAGIHLGNNWDITGSGESSGGDVHFLFSNEGVTRKLNASTFWRDESEKLRGNGPLLPPTGSPVASGPLSVVFAMGNPKHFLGNRPVKLALSARERFTYLR